MISAGCEQVVRVRFSDALVKITERSTIQYLNVHDSKDVEVLSLWNHDYLNVRGNNPCYLRLPGRTLILFVTGLDFDGGQAIVHLADTSTRQVEEFPAYDSHIGSCIGGAESNQSERIVSLDGNLLTIEATLSDRHFTYLIDLSGPRFVRESSDFKHGDGTVEHFVYEGGKAPKA